VPYAPLRGAHHPRHREQYGTASMRAAAYKIRFSMLSNLPRRTGQLCGGFLLEGLPCDRQHEE
jgi:hypothetical protein